MADLYIVTKEVEGALFNFPRKLITGNKRVPVIEVRLDYSVEESGIMQGSTVQLV